MNETPKQKPGGTELTLTLSGKQQAGLFGVMLVVFLAVKFLHLALFPAECSDSGGLIFAFVVLPMVYCGIVLIPAWTKGGDRLMLLREGGLLLAIIIGNSFAHKSVECHFEGAWYWTALYLPVFVGVLYFMTTRLMWVADRFADDRPSVGASKDGDAA